MYINEQYHDLPLLEEKKHVYIGRGGERREEAEEVLKEHHMDIYVNEQLTMKLVCIPQYLSELVLGRLLTEGIIRTAGDVEQLYICEQGLRARVMLSEERTAAGLSGAFAPQKTDAASGFHDTAVLSNAAVPPAKDSVASSFVEETPSCCTDNHILNDRFAFYKDLKPVTPIRWEPDWIFDLADRFSAGMPLHEKTWATHSCFLARKGELLFSCEDIGRHNALDKAIGFALRHNLDPGSCILYSSGRIPVDMVTKAIRAGIPVLASKASPTAEAADLAQKYRLTLLCAARRDRMKQFA